MFFERFWLRAIDNWRTRSTGIDCLSVVAEYGYGYELPFIRLHMLTFPAPFLTTHLGVQSLSKMLRMRRVPACRYCSSSIWRERSGIGIDAVIFNRFSAPVEIDPVETQQDQLYFHNHS